MFFSSVSVVGVFNLRRYVRKQKCEGIKALSELWNVCLRNVFTYHRRSCRLLWYI